MTKGDPLDYGLWLLCYGPKSRQGMKRAMEKKGYEEDEVTAALDRMQQWGYLNDQSYAENLIRRKKNNNVKGKTWLRRTLAEEGIPLPDDFDLLYKDEEEQEIIRCLLAKWCGGAEISDKDRQKYYGRLVRRGFKRENIFYCFDLCREFGEADAFQFED